jgi:hypothetical protein
MVRGVVSREAVRRTRRRLRTNGGPRRPAFVLCVALAAWTWWSAQADGYTGLSINILGQITGDVLLMGLIAPLAGRARPECTAERGEAFPAGAPAAARRRVQLLDPRICLPRICAGGRASLVHELRTALENDTSVEILLPDPGAPASRAAARRLGLEPRVYVRCLEGLLEELFAACANAPAGQFGLRLYTDPVDLCFVRCDERIWASLTPEGDAASPEYFALDRRCAAARLLQSYFKRLYVGAGPRTTTGGRPNTTCADERLG